MDPKLQIYVDLNAKIDAATIEWNRVALAAWCRLREEDPELADLALRFFDSDEAAASWFASRQGDATCYGRLAAGDRYGVSQQLAAAIDGFYI